MDDTPEFQSSRSIRSPLGDDPIKATNSSGDEIANVNFFTTTYSTTFTQCAPEPIPNSVKQRKIKAITPFKVIQGHRF